MTRLTADMCVSAYLRRAQGAGRAVYVLRRGDASAGAILLRVARLDGTAEVFARSYDLEGAAVWVRAHGDAPVPEREVDDYVARAVERDPDLWVIEIESPDGAHFLEDGIL